ISLGLEFLHFCKVLHRDIKPANVFLRGDDCMGCETSMSAQLGDFGLARVLDRTQAMANTVCGTPYTMSPELLKGVPYNHKSDVWALGCVAFEMMSLSLPFQANNMVELSQRVQRQPTPPLPDFYSLALRQLVGAMLHKSVRTRLTAQQIVSHGLIAPRCVGIARAAVAIAPSFKTPLPAPGSNQASKLKRKMSRQDRMTAAQMKLPGTTSDAQTLLRAASSVSTQVSRLGISLPPPTSSNYTASPMATPKPSIHSQSSDIWLPDIRTPEAKPKQALKDMGDVALIMKNSLKMCVNKKMGKKKNGAASDPDTALPEGSILLAMDSFKKNNGPKADKVENLEMWLSQLRVEIEQQEKHF
ncbi:hypothetical protein CYMTET_46850, partial [Cymbomonas tetramitiformis]